MPTQSHYDKSNKMIYHRYWAHLTRKEFIDSLSDEQKFFDQMTGKVGVVFDLSALENLPPSILTIARKAHFVRYQPLVIGLVGADYFVQAITHVVNQITHTSIYNFDTLEKATAYMKTQIKPIDLRENLALEHVDESAGFLVF